MRLQEFRLIGTLSALAFGGVWLATSPDGVFDEPYYRYCSDARLAGVAPILKGEAGYRAGLDADSDGVACETYKGY